ncbi:MAG: CDF family Co(II)/Ni(II) efflux transporter DmeF [Ignavibacteria bacterium]|nr:CDF family Co(II)/Ni(II) efflux transporter DmeF [Ignavibacteria bacterium]
MHQHSIRKWQHAHIFGQDITRAGEKRTLIVILITASMMVVEIISGVLFGSMALLADGLHMASHTAALGISAFAYYYARKHSKDESFSFGTGKVNALAGFSSAVLLVVFALIMTWESVHRFMNPVEIIFDQAIIVAVLGLVVNAISYFILSGRHNLNHSNANVANNQDHSDHNLRAATLHVLADALTSIFAIIALLTAKYVGLIWMDPLMGIVGAILVARWSISLLRDTSSILLDKQASIELQNQIRNSIESHNGNKVADLHIWAIGPNLYNAIISVVTDAPKQPDHYRKMIPDNIGLVHTTIEIHKCDDEDFEH